MEIVGRLGSTGVRGGGGGGGGSGGEGQEEEEVRLRTVIGTSEQPPEGAELAPLHDRFLFAAELSAVSHSARLQLLDRQPSEDEIDCRLLGESVLLTVEEMDALKVRKTTLFPRIFQYPDICSEPVLANCCFVPYETEARLCSAG